MTIRSYKKVQVFNVRVKKDGGLYVPGCATEDRHNMQERLPDARIPDRDYVATYRVCSPSRATGVLDGGFYHHEGSEHSSYVLLYNIDPEAHVRRTVRLKPRKKR